MATEFIGQYNHEYYLLKHLSHFVQKGAKLLRTTGSFDNMLAFKNPDDSIILVVQNELKENRQLNLKLDGTYISVDLKADSFTTLKVE